MSLVERHRPRRIRRRGRKRRHEKGTEGQRRRNTQHHGLLSNLSTARSYRTLYGFVGSGTSVSICLFSARTASLSLIVSPDADARLRSNHQNRQFGSPRGRSSARLLVRRRSSPARRRGSSTASSGCSARAGSARSISRRGSAARRSSRRSSASRSARASTAGCARRTSASCWTGIRGRFACSTRFR